MNIMVKFWLLLFIVYVVNGFPEGQKKDAFSKLEKIEAIQGFPSNKINDYEDYDENEVKYVACPDPNFHCNYHHPVCVCGGSCCPLNRPNFYAGFCYAVHF